MKPQSENTASPYPAAACQSCGGWSKSGGMSHKADGAEGCSCTPCGGQRSHGEFDLILVSCCGEKLKGEHRAEDLYQSQLFKASVAWAKANGKQWAILSAKHGIVWPDDVIESYDLKLSGPDSLLRLKPIYNNLVCKQLLEYKHGFHLAETREWIDSAGPKIAVLAGKNYVEPFKYEPNTSFPLAGKGIGQRLQFLKKAVVAVTACVSQLELF